MYNVNISNKNACRSEFKYQTRAPRQS